MERAAAMLVVGFGGLVVGFGLACLEQPGRLRAMVDAIGERRIVAIGAGLRAVVGGSMLLAAPSASEPTAVRALGGLFVAAAVLIVALGSARVWRMAQWWVAQPDAMLRAGGAVTIAVGGFMIYACI